jgi:hypothetical protein
VPALALTDRNLREQVHFRLMSGPVVRRTLGLMKARGNPISPTAQAFERILRETLGRKTLEQFPGINVQRSTVRAA